MPLLVMMYTRGDKVLAECDEQYVKIAARVASEMGADMVKVSFTGSVESFARVVEGSSIPVLIAGRGFFFRGIPALFRLTPNMDSLVSCGAAAGIVYSLILMITSSHAHLYFDASAMIIT